MSHRLKVQAEEWEMTANLEPKAPEVASPVRALLPSGMVRERPHQARGDWVGDSPMLSALGV